MCDISHLYSEAEGDGESEQSQIKEAKDGMVNMVYLSAFGLAEFNQLLLICFDVQSCKEWPCSTTQAVLLLSCPLNMETVSSYKAKPPLIGGEGS